jgi:hypothetical protein
MIKFACPQCGKGISAADEHAGKKARCPQCQHIMPIPQASKPAPAAPPRPSAGPARPSAAREAVAPRPAPKPAPPRKKAPPPEDDDVPEVEEVEDVETLEEVEEEERPRRRRRATDEDEEGIQERPRRRARAVEDEEPEEEEEEEEERPRRRKKRRRRREGQWADCPNCGAPGDATRIWWTPWGGLVGPAMICHVRCNDCGTTYNGKSGEYNTTAIIIFVVVSVVIGAALGVLGIVLAEMK